MEAEAVWKETKHLKDALAQAERALEKVAEGLDGYEHGGGARALVDASREALAAYRTERKEGK